MDTDLVTLNGIDADTGGYLFPQVPVEELARLAQDEDPRSAYFEAMRNRHAAAEDQLGTASFVDDPEDLAQAGWGLVYPKDLDPEVLDALEPLLARRAAQAGKYFKKLVVEPNEPASDFLWRNGMGPDPADPREVPYYLLIVGSPRAIPFTFQYELDVQYAVGRVDFDTVEEYATYARHVLAADERDRQPLAVHLFGTCNAGDQATALSSSRLVEPLAEQLVQLAPGIDAGRDVGAAATKARLLHLLTAGPPVLFTATHGLGRTHGYTPDSCGALVCQDWPGALAPHGPVDPAHYLAASDIPAGQPLASRIVFAFACYGAGISEQSAVAQLPQRLLTGGVLGFIGHVDKAWGYSFLWQGATPQITSMVGTLLSIRNGRRLGVAMEQLNSRATNVATLLSNRLIALRDDGRMIDDQTLAWLWTATYDARNYVVLGDPAVRAC